jgi:hypothetical protein
LLQSDAGTFVATTLVDATARRWSEANMDTINPGATGRTSRGLRMRRSRVLSRYAGRALSLIWRRVARPGIYRDVWLKQNRRPPAPAA